MEIWFSEVSRNRTFIWRPARQIQEQPEECYAIEDSYNGIRAAKRAGLHPIMVPDLSAPTMEMEELSDCILPSLHEVQQYFEKTKKADKKIK